jgi:hypothetical protein
MKTGKNCSCALISCNRSKSRSAAKNQSNFAAEKKNLLDGTLVSRGEHGWKKKMCGNPALTEYDLDFRG